MTVQVERNVLSQNGHAGFRACVDAGSIAANIRGTLSRNGLIGNFLGGIHLEATGGPGGIVMNVIENTVRARTLDISRPGIS